MVMTCLADVTIIVVFLVGVRSAEARKKASAERETLFL